MIGKRLAALALSLVLLVGLMSPAVLRASAEGDSTVYVRKHVSMLYDDSGSMSSTKVDNNLKWTFASYAAQAFTGLLNDTDSLTITFMNHVGERADQLTVDLQKNRAEQVSAVKSATGTVVKQGNTPLDRIDAALQVLLDQGLGSAGGQNEQYWLVLMTDGIFTDEQGNELSEADVTSKLTYLLSTYPEMNLVYFGIGTSGLSGTSVAKDFRKDSTLNGYANFSAVYAPNQDAVVSTMQELSTQISGRYNVTDSAQVSGSTVKMEVSGESSPIRNVAVLAQNTNAQLVSASAVDGTKLEITRSAALSYPQNDTCANVPAGTLGGYTALISGPDGEKIPSGDITLTFSEPVQKNSLTLMYEPAIHLNMITEKKLPSGQWETLGSSSPINDGDTIRISYAICEDGSNEPLEETDFFGKTQVSITAGGKSVKAGEEFQVSEGDTAVTVQVSMMDGAYQISTTRTLKVVALRSSDFRITSSGPIILNRGELGENTEQFIDFTIQYNGEAAGEDLLSGFACAAASSSGEVLEGTVTQPGNGVVRFIPRDGDAPADSYTVSLTYNGEEACREQVTVSPEIYYTATASGSFSVLDNEVGSCTDSVRFTVTAHVDGAESPITRGEASLFRITTNSENGDSLNWNTSYEEGGVIALTPVGDSAVPGAYTVSLVEEENGQVLSTASVSVLKHDAVYVVEPLTPEEEQVNLFALDYNEACLGFRVYMDGQLCTAEQLQGMLDSGVLTARADRSSGLLRLVVTVGEIEGAPAVICTPTSKGEGHVAAFWQRIPIAYGMVCQGEMTITLTVNQPKGAEGSGALTLFGSLLLRVFYILLPWLILLAVVLVGMVIYSNLRMPRFKPGVITYVELTLLSAGKYSVGIADTLPTHSHRFYLKLLPLPQRVSFRGVTFTARAPSAGKRRKKRFYPPAALISGSAAEINSCYCSNLPNRPFLEMLNYELSGGEIARREVPVTGVAPFEPGMVDNMDAEQIWTPALSDGAYLVKKQFEGKKLVGIEIWGFLEDN